MPVYATAAPVCRARAGQLSRCRNSSSSASRLLLSTWSAANWALTLVGNVLKAAGTKPGALGAMALAYLMVAVVFVVNYATDGANRGPVDMPETESATPVAAPTAPVKRAAVTTTGATSAAETAGRTATAVIDEEPPQRF
ncbi:MAG TPA: hypothetical protein P5181_05120 [Dermatophilaceae bacterium]|nr:hypothetical protein [Dermatophilaceae bacterium]